ncbi:Splicing factor U2AF-associated protein 2 [Tolypocladium ophioglossoides CBS 100239]|uniref:Splicing factor U2AF-associated protein 2 n=1 Tax=Tolypocladium ophioglossoides (strain CBS 100239) TaxID=1163406 RepID=A0A0L0N666_TOLOC|nr:Splicing factor U2AF-associated protein 2 [Tolypocladium ophioglossoides CBS 100239]
MDGRFPTNPEEFDGDHRISFSTLDSKFIAVHDDGTEFEFDAELKQWLPIEEPPLDSIEYGGEASAPEGGEGTQKKRKQETANGSESAESSRPSKRTKPPPRPKQNTAVYVTGLPSDATVADIHELFSRKGGLIAEEIDSGAPRIKLYKDESGNFKGDALIVFFKPQSVRMAIMLLDDTFFRYTANGQGEGRMRVEEADSSYKKVQYDQEGGAPASEGGGQVESRRSKNERDRQKVIKRTQKLDARLADWSDDEDDRFKALTVANNPKRSKKVVLRQMFRIFELEEDPASILEIKEDIREECSKVGTVTSVVLYDQEPEGIVTVKSQDADAAVACVNAMSGRPFDCRVVHAELATGKEKFRKNDKTRDDSDSD